MTKSYMDVQHHQMVISFGPQFTAGPASRMEVPYNMRLPRWVPREHYSRLRYADLMPRVAIPLHYLQCLKHSRVCLV